MTLLVFGVLLFAVVHFIPSLAPSLRVQAVDQVGEGGFKGIFSLLLAASLACIVIGWRNSVPTALYTPPVAVHKAALGLLGFAFLLMVVSARNSRLRLLVRHPQLTAVALWGASHLLLNGDSRSAVLFGGMTAWALLEIAAINRRDGVWIKGRPPSWGAEVVTLTVAVIAVAVVVSIHPWLSGVPVSW